MRQSFAVSMGYIAQIPLNFSLLAVHMWYIYLLIGLYLYLPIFSAWVEKASERAKLWFLAAWGVTLLLPYYNEYVSEYLWGGCSWNAFGMLYYFAGFNGYLLLGHYLRNHDWSGRQLVFIGMPMFVAGYAVTFLGFRHMTSLPDFTDEMLELYFTYCSLNVVMMTIPVFVLCKRANIKSERVRRALANLTLCGFRCVYDTLFLYRTECGTDARYPYSHSFADTLCGSGGILCILVSGSDGLSLFREEDEMGVGIGMLNYLSAFSTARTFSALSVRHCCTSCILTAFIAYLGDIVLLHAVSVAEERTVVFESVETRPKYGTRIIVLRAWNHPVVFFAFAISEILTHDTCYLVCLEPCDGCFHGSDDFG